MQIEPIGAPHVAATSDPAVTHAARGFEQLLVRQLAQTLVSSFGGEDEDGADGGGAKSLYSELLPDALTDAIDQAGGLGLAHSLAPTLERAA
jgi:Rod binding domain-containing protein